MNDPSRDGSEVVLKKQDTLMEKNNNNGAKVMNDSDDSEEMVGGINQKAKNFDSSSDGDDDKIKGDTKQIIKDDIKSNLLKQIV